MFIKTHAWLRDLYVLRRFCRDDVHIVSTVNTFLCVRNSRIAIKKR